MLGFCDRNKGAISVFLTLILLPVLLLGGLTVDAARIYASRVVISDSGEMAMNAGLAQYDAGLHDEYGLLVMMKSPEAMEAELASFFEKSLNGTGIPGAEDYEQILHLVSEQFEAINLEGSQIYKTEVEKQQIVEYMKYRAPVCLTELVLEKLEVLKDTKKMTEAMEAQMDFGEAMEDCNDSMEDAKEVLDDLNALLNLYPTPEQLNRELVAAQGDYTVKVSRCLLMLAAISNYTEADGRGDAEASAQSYIAAAGGVSVGDDSDSRESFEHYMQCLYYQAGEQDAGGLDKVLDEWRAQEPEDEEDPGYSAWKTRMDELEQLKEDYDSARDAVSGYPGQLRRIAYDQCIVPHTTMLHGYWEDAETGKQLSQKAYSKLEIVKENLEDAAEKWKNWSNKTDALGDKAESMEKSVDEYKDFFNGGDSDDMESLERLMEEVQTDQIRFGKIKDALEEETFFGQSIAKVSSDTQYQIYLDRANGSVSSSMDQFMDIEGVRDPSYKSNYHHITVPNDYALIKINSSPFYKKLIEFFDTAESDEAARKKRETNEKLDESKDAGEAAQSEDGYPDYTWTMDGSMPSVALGLAAPEGAEAGLADVGGNVSNKSGRRDAISKFKKSINEATSFMDGLDRIIADNLENLYVAEYAMQMFSHYTVDKKDGTTLPDEEIIGLSGYQLKEHKPYKAEIEYILWGDTSSQKNIRNTVMLLFGIRLLFNSFFAFTNARIIKEANEAAAVIAGAAPYLIPVVQFIIELALAGLETANDIEKIKNGYGVTIIKSADTWATVPFFKDNTKGVTLDYSEYLRIFLNINMLSGKEVQKLARIADCIRVNTDFDMINGYTMLAVEAKVKVRTTFMRKISELGSGGWTQPGNTYTVQYQSILGY